ncbi:MAG: hypothetical protein EOO38_22865 [Cytophagaceae bacterium]|nr:MAG: hypothetical protein EOO38_22865 [Cytophagaceae bacterium]
MRRAEVRSAQSIDFPPGLALEDIWAHVKQHLAVSVNTLVIGLDARASSTRQLVFPFTDVKRIESAVAFELEGQVPYAIDDVAVIIWEKDWNKMQRQNANALSLFGEEDGFGPVPKSFRIKLVSSCGRLRDYHFPRNKSIEEDSLIYQAAENTLSVCGEQILPIGSDASQSFFTQSMAFPISRNGELEHRIFTMVHLKQPDWEW